MSASAATIPITGGEVDWGIKQSFREYVKGPIAKGQIEVSGGATEAADGTYKFPVGSGTYDLTTHQVEVQGVGTVHFTGHDMGAGPLLDVTFTNPRVVVGKTSVVYADVVSKTFPGGEVKSYPNAEFALVDASTAKPIFEGEAVTLKSMPTELTTAGSEAFSGFIPPGEELDPLSLTASYAPLVQPEEPKKEEPQSDQPKTDTPTTPAPTVATPKLKSAGGTSQLGSGGSATVATVACQSSLPCQLTAPKSVKFKLGGKSFAAKVVAPKWILAGKRGKVAVKVPKPALEQLGGGKLKIRLKLVLGTGTDAQTKVVKVTLKGKG
ncbi:MAG: hypothetical protein BGO11_00490 [Solirubrobacterales bacterium 70-9]|nr:MAG: hypothetical protein BGO11_00490 [Solirubrobacterales bacterium 70-9]